MLEQPIELVYQQFCARHPLRQVRLAGQHWQYIASGAGAETVLLLPGGFGAADTSFHYILALETAYRVISVTYPPAAATCGQLLAGLLLLLAHEQVERAHIVGGSASGLVAQCFVRSHGQQVASLVLSHTSLPQPSRVRWLAPLVALLDSVPLPLLRGILGIINARFLPESSPVQQFWRGYFASAIQRLTRDALLNRFRILLDIDRNYAFAAAETLAQPVLMLSAARDSFVSPGEQRRLAQFYPHAKRIYFAAGIHADSVTNPTHELAAIRAFLAASGTTQRNK